MRDLKKVSTASLAICLGLMLFSTLWPKEDVAAKAKETDTIMPEPGTAPYWIIGDDFPNPVEQPGIGELKGNSCLKCHRVQCIPEFFNYDPGEITMMTGPLQLHYTDKMADDLAELNEWCKSQEIDYFGGLTEEEKKLVAEKTK